MTKSDIKPVASGMRSQTWLAVLVVAFVLTGSATVAQSVLTGDMRLFENDASFCFHVGVNMAPVGQHDALRDSLTAYLLERARVLGFSLQRCSDFPRFYVRLDAVSGGAGSVVFIASNISRNLVPGSLVGFQGWVDLRTFTWRNPTDFERAAKEAANEMLEGFVVAWRERQ